MSASKVTRIAIAFGGSVLLAVAFLFATTTTAGAHVVPAGDVSIDCESVSFSYSAFPTGPQPITVTVTQAGETKSYTASTDGNASGTVTVPVELTADGPVEVTITWSADGGGSTFAEGSLECAPEVVPPPVVPPVVPELVPPATVTAPTPVEVLSVPQVAARPQAPTQAVSTPAAMAFTGPREVAAETLAGCLLLAAGFLFCRRGTRRTAGIAEGTR